MSNKIRKLFFERIQEVHGEVPKNFVYNELPEKIRNQIVLIWDNSPSVQNQSKKAVQDLREALGMQELADGGISTFHNEYGWCYDTELKTFFLETKNVQYALTALEEIGRLLRHYNPDGLQRINERLRLGGIGWKHTGEILIKIEDEVFFAEVTSRCLSILGEKKYYQTQEYLIKAYEELKQGPKNFDDALTDCRMALETVIKTRLMEAGYSDIKTKNWRYLKPILLNTVIAPSYWNNYLNILLNLMEGNITPSNQEGSHGQFEGSKFQADEVFVRYIINQTAANILFIAETEFKKKAMVDG